MWLARYLSTDEWLRAIGNLEGREEYFWLYQEMWRVAHAVLGLDPSLDRFSSTDWRLALETDIAGLASWPLLLSSCRSDRNAQMAAWLDEFLDAHWVECGMTALRYGLLRNRASRRSVQEVEAQLSGQNGAGGPGRVLDDLSTVLADLDGNEWVVVVGPRGAPHFVGYERVLPILHDSGKPVLWLEYSSDFLPGDDVEVGERPWGRIVTVPLPALTEVMIRQPSVADEYKAALAALRKACRSLPGRWRSAAKRIEPMLPVVLARWLSSHAVAEALLERLRVSVVGVTADKYTPARAFVLGARRRGIPSLYLWNSTSVSAPQYWPITDRILVANGARAERLVEMLGIPPERIQPVGSLEVDGLLGGLQVATPFRRKGELRFSLLLKWPAQVAFGLPQEVGAMLSELSDKGGTWFCILRPHPKDWYDYGWLEQAFPGWVRITRPGYWDTAGLVETFAGTDLVVAAMGNAVLLSIAAGKPTVIYNPDPKINLGQDRLLARDDLPGHVRLVTNRDELLRLLRRVMDGQEPELMKPERLKPSLEQYLFHSLDGRTTGRIVAALLEPRRVGHVAPSWIAL